MPRPFTHGVFVGVLLLLLAASSGVAAARRVESNKGGDDFSFMTWVLGFGHGQGDLSSAMRFVDDAANEILGLTDTVAIDVASSSGLLHDSLLPHDVARGLTCRRVAKEWLAISEQRTAMSQLQQMRGDQFLSFVARTWLPCARLSGSDLLLGRSSPQHDAAVAALVDAAERLRHAMKRPPVGGDVAPAAVAALGASLRAIVDLATESSVVARFAAPVLRPVAAAMEHQPAQLLRQWTATHDDDAATAMAPVPYWQFLPPLAGRAAPGAGKVAFKTRCFSSVSVTATWDATKEELTAEIDALGTSTTATVPDAEASLCAETLLLYAGGSFALDLALWDQLWHKQHLKVKGKADNHAAFLWDAETIGVRVFYSTEPLLGTVASVLETVAYCLTSDLSFSGQLDPATEMNGAMMANAFTPIGTGFTPAAPNTTYPDADAFVRSLHTGDVLAATRLGPIDTLFNFLQSENVAHVSVVACPPGAEGTASCIVCESRPQANFWLSANGVQCHAAPAWFQLVRNISNNVVHLPLTNAVRANISANAAMAEATRYVGVDYGYQNWGFAWLDGGGNMPCFPMSASPNAVANSTHCLAFDLAQMVFSVVDDVLPAFGAYYLGEGLNNRLSATKGNFPGAHVTACFERAWKLHQWNMTQLLAQPEVDDWTYYSLRGGEIYNGTVYSASKYVCSVLRASGALQSGGAMEYECGEITNWGITALAIFNASQLQQVAGDYSFAPGPQFNTRPVAPGMFTDCPSADAANGFDRPTGC